jgi:hypothetical protein
MVDSWAGRLAAIGVLLAVLFVLTVGYGTLGPAPSLGAYPSEDDIAPDPGSYIGQQVHLSGQVVETDPVVITTDYAYYADGERVEGALDLTVRNVDTAVSRGDTLQVFGTLGPEQTIQAQNVVVVPAVNYAYMYTVSALAGLWVLARLVAGWRVDWPTGALERRETPRPLTRSLLDRLSEVFG